MGGRKEKPKGNTKKSGVCCIGKGKEKRKKNGPKGCFFVQLLPSEVKAQNRREWSGVADPVMREISTKQATSG